MQRTKPINDRIYHVYNRGVEKRKVFMDDSDYLRFIHDIFEFNDQNPAPNMNYYLKKHISPTQYSEVKPPNIGFKDARKLERKPRKFLIELMVFCLMPNHFHLMIRQLVENGITRFMHKLGTGYTYYFNLKYNRVGSLFQGTYKCVEIKQESHLIHLPLYIHLNPLDLFMPEWKKRKLKNYKKALKFIENYKWSSYQDYIGKKNFPSVTQREFLLEFFDGSKNYKRNVRKWFKEINFEEIKDLTLE